MRGERVKNLSRLEGKDSSNNLDATRSGVCEPLIYYSKRAGLPPLCWTWATWRQNTDAGFRWRPGSGFVKRRIAHAVAWLCWAKQPMRNRARRSFWNARRASRTLRAAPYSTAFRLRCVVDGSVSLRGCKAQKAACINLVGNQRMGSGGTRMSDELYACVCAAEFPAQALLRLRTELQSEPVAVLEGRAPLETVCSLNRAATLKGAVLGMTRLEAEGIAGLRLLARSVDVESAARAVLLECLSQFSPRIEEASTATTCGFVLDIAGTGLLFGPPETLAKRLRAALTTAGFRASIAVSTNFHVARLKAATTREITVIPEGQEATALAKLPLAALNLEENHAETFAIWGIRTLGELAALPEVDLIARLGQQARHWRDLARGVAAHTFQPIEAEFTLKEFFDFETPIEEMDSLLFIGARMIDCLVARASARGHCRWLH
jgi:hypothetical protein